MESHVVCQERLGIGLPTCYAIIKEGMCLECKMNFHSVEGNISFAMGHILVFHNHDIYFLLCMYELV